MQSDNMQAVSEPLNQKVTAKIRSLYDCQLRLMHNIQPLPSGIDIANTVKYFSQTLLSVLKDVPRSPLEMLRDAENDAERMALYPNLDYKGLFTAISQLVDAAPHLQYGVQAFGEAILQCLGCLLPFLEYDMIDNLPYLVAYCVAMFPASLHQHILHLLTYYILPFTITRKYAEQEEESQASQSVAAVIMMVFQHSSNPAHHCQLLECLMSMKQSVVGDVLCVIAYGTCGARVSAAKLLFYYWPPFDPNLFDRKGLLCKFSNELAPFLCQRDMCPNLGSAEAAKVCYDHCISVTFASDTPPPLYLCIECANEIHREHPNQRFFDILHPQQQVSMVCENKNCRSTDKAAYSICFSNECASYNGNHPIRYCQQCHSNRHNSRRGGDHVVHSRLPPAWSLPPHLQVCLVEAVISLIKEAKPINMEDPDCMSEQCKPPLNVTLPDPISIEDRQLLGRYGVWLLVGLCSPNPDTPDEVLARLLSVLFHWFHVTSYAYTSETALTVERLKQEQLCPWLRALSARRARVVVAELLPAAAAPARPQLLADQLNRLYCLIPYGIVDQQMWDYIMPFWMDALCSIASEKELKELKVTVGKILEPDGAMVGIDEKNLYNFAVVKVTDTPTADTVLPVLEWFQTLSLLEVKVPLSQLFDLFSHCVVNMPEKIFKPPSSTSFDNANSKSKVEAESPPLSEDSKKEEEPSKPQTLTSCILMLDILLKQMELQRRRINISVVSGEATKLLRLMLKSNQLNTIEHAECVSEGSCSYCEAAALWHQLAVTLVRDLFPEKPKPFFQPPYEDSSDSLPKRSEEERSKSGGTPATSVDHLGGPTPHSSQASVGGVLVHMPHIMTATVETITEQLDMAVSLQEAPPPPPATAHTVTLTETDVATATATVSTPNLVNEQEPLAEAGGDDMVNFWSTSAGKFHFCIESLPHELQYIHQLLQELKSTSRPDVLYHLLQCLQVLVLNSDAISDHRGFLIWCQENLLIDNLWNVCNASHSHISSVAVPILLHCVTLAGGADVFCGLIRDQFHHTDSQVRFTAVERVTIIIRFMDGSPIKTSLPLQTALATAFCYLISTMDDINVYVAQRATLYIGTIHDNAIDLLLYCLETQFDLVIVDRPMVLQSVYQLHNTLGDRNILTWQFFLNRFEALLLEAQINSNNAVDFNHLKELVSSDASRSDYIMCKVRRAHEALAATAGGGAGSGAGGGAGAGPGAGHSLSASFGAKWPYKRTISAPATVPEHEPHLEREKVYSRQYSAPLLKRKTSRFGLGQLLAAPAPTTNAKGNVHEFQSSSGRSEEAPLHRNVDLEETDRETTNLLVFLLMQFLSRSDQALPSEEKNEARTQEAVLRHLFLLLGYNCSDKYFHVAPHTLRQSSIFNAFMANLPQVLDQNHVMGASIAEPTLLLLQYSSAPGSGSGPAGGASHSLAALEPHVRRHWLMALLVVLYKYHYGTGTLCSIVLALVRIVLATVEAQYHQCKPGRVPPPRQREVSSPSLVDWGARSGVATTGASTEDRSTGASTNNQYEHHKTQPKYQQWSLEQESSESELIAIPETSDKSDTTVHGSTAPGSFDEPSHYDEAPKGENSPNAHATLNKVAPVGSRSNHQLSTSSSVSIGSDSSNLKSTPMSGQSVDMWPEQLLHQHRNNRGKQKRIVVGSGTSSECGVCCVSPPTYTVRSPACGSSTSPESPVPQAPLHIPPTERLLPIGPKPNKEQYPVFDTLVDRVREALNIPTDEVPDKTDSEKTQTKSEREQVPLPFSRPHEFTKTLSTDGTTRSRGPSPRRLPRQTAHIESPPPSVQGPPPNTSNEPGGSVLWWERWSRGGRRAAHARANRAAALSLYTCAECGSAVEQYSDEELGLCVIVLATFVHREPAAAAAVLPALLNSVSRVVHLGRYSWQTESGSRLPGGAVLVAHQFLRCCLHQLAPNNIFLQVFLQTTPEKQRQSFFKSIAQAFVDFSELYPCGPLQLLLEHLNSNKTLPLDKLPTIMSNMAVYLECLSSEALGPAGACQALLLQLEQLLRAAVLQLPQLDTTLPLLRAAAAALKLPNAHLVKSILEPISKITSYSLQNFVVSLSLACSLSCAARVFGRERERLLVSRVLVYQLLQALRTKVTVPDENLFVLLQFLLHGHGCTLLLPAALRAGPLLALPGGLEPRDVCAGAPDCMRAHLPDLLDLLHDPSLINNIKGSVSKSIVNRNLICLNEDTLGAIVKGGIAQYVAVELSTEHGRGKSQPDKGQLNRHIMPWLTNNNLPGGREVGECLGRVRALCWLVLGALCNLRPPAPSPASCPAPSHAPFAAPLPQDATCHIVDHIQTIMSSYVEQSKPHAQRMNWLFHAFILCHLWTMYLEQLSTASPPSSEPYNTTVCILLDFWCKLVPSALQLTAQSKILAETVNLHFLSLLESLLECNSTLLYKLLPLWTPILHSPLFTMPAHVSARVSACLTSPPRAVRAAPSPAAAFSPSPRTLQRLRNKCAMLEMQPNTFYTI